MSTIQKYWLVQAAKRRCDHGRGHLVIDPVVCKDGYEMSVQASACHYSQPRWKFLKSGRYTRWEVMPLSRPVHKELAKYGHGRVVVGDVCGFVPTEVIDAIIAKHGGLE